MIEMINDLKNNKLRPTMGRSSLRSESLSQMRKILGSLNANNRQPVEPLRVSLQDIRNPQKKGKWWLGGAGEAHNEANLRKDESTPNEALDTNLADLSVVDPDLGPSGLLQLAKEQQMNTEARRAIFVSIMSATDHRDAHLRLTKLRLKRAQEMEIPRVLIQCAGAERSYNPYYTLIARRLCMDRRLKMAFQFSLWGQFKVMGEVEDDEEMKDDELDDLEEENDDNDVIKTGSPGMRKIVNLAKLYGALIVDGALGLGVLKVRAAHC